MVGGDLKRTLYYSMPRSLRFAEILPQMDTDGMVLLICVFLRESVAQFSWLRLAALGSLFSLVQSGLAAVADRRYSGNSG
jgi:hypothetical protein